MGSKRTRVQAPKQQEYTPVYMKDGNYYKRSTPVQSGATKGSPGKPRQALGNNPIHRNKGKFSQPSYEQIQGPCSMNSMHTMDIQPYKPQVNYNPMGYLGDPYGGGKQQRQYDPNVASMPMPVNKSPKPTTKPSPGGGLMKYGATRAGQIGMAPNLFR